MATRYEKLIEEERKRSPESGFDWTTGYGVVRGPHGEAAIATPTPPKKEAPKKNAPPPNVPRPQVSADPRSIANLRAGAQIARSGVSATPETIRNLRTEANQKGDSFDEKLAQITSNRNALDLNDPAQMRNFIASAYDSLRGIQNAASHRDVVTSMDVMAAENASGSNPGLRGREAAVKAAYNSPANQQLMAELGGERRVSDLQALDQQRSQETSAAWEIARNALGIEGAAKLTPDELREYLRETNASVARAATEPQRSPRELRYSGAISDAKTNYATAYLPVTAPAPLQPAPGAPTVAEMRDRLNTANTLIDKTQIAQAQAQAPTEQQIAQPLQPVAYLPPKENEDEY